MSKSKSIMSASLALLSMLSLAATIPLASFADYGQPAFTTPATQNPQVLRVTYVPSDTNLLIQTSRIQEVTLYNPTYDPQSKKYHFYLNNAVIPASPSNIPVQNDALVEGIHLNQSWSGQVPVVDVTMDMKANPGMNLAFVPQKIMQDGNFMISIRPQGTMPNGSGVMNGTGPVVTNTYPMTQPINPVQPRPLQTLAYGQAAPAAMTGPIQMLAYGQIPASAQSAQMANILVPQGASNLPLVSDIFVDKNHLDILSNNQALTVERAFTLTTPDRYVVDIGPARLSKNASNRLVGDSEAYRPFQVRLSQLDNDTVRVVLDFQQNPGLPIQLTQQQQNHLVRLSY